MQADAERVTPESDEAGAWDVTLDAGVRGDVHPRLKPPVVARDWLNSHWPRVRVRRESRPRDL